MREGLRRLSKLEDAIQRIGPGFLEGLPRDVRR